MRVFKNLSIEDSVDLFCSTLGNEIVFETEKGVNLLLPCFNIGFYDCEINESLVTKGIDICYFMFDNINEYEINLSVYNYLNSFMSDFNTLQGNKISSKCIYNNESIEKRKEFYLEGNCLRNNSLSYAGYKILAQTLDVILLNESNILNNYTSNDEYTRDPFYKNFLLNRDKKCINQLISSVL